MNTRLAYFAGVVVCLGLMGAGLYLQYIEHQEPCPMCILQRIAYIGLVVLFGIAALHGPRRTAATVYSTLIVLVAAAGAAVAARQVWLQQLPKDQVPACGPGLEYMMRKFPLHEVLDKVLSGSGECAEVGWRFLGLSIAGWSLVWFVLLAGYAAYIALRMRREHAR
ncbi:MAG TPA: disulfide bond formation protein B [Burkholderiales bacterium]